MQVPRGFLRSVAAVQSERPWTFAAVGLALLAMLGVTSAGPADGQERPEQRSQVRLTSEQCEKLIDNLASRNSPPTISEKDPTADPRYPPNFDKSDQDRVRKAYDALGERVEELLPHLVKHADDDRYSYTAESPSGSWSNNSVGFACRSILRANVATYVPLVRRSTWLLKSGFPTNPKDIQRWWSDQNGKELWQLQLHWLEWALEEERKTTFESTKEEAAVVGGLQRAIEKLKETEAPIKVEKRLILRPK